MRTFTSKFILLASLGVLLLSGLQGDRSAMIKPGDASVVASTDANESALMVDEGQLVKKPSKSDDRPTFRFPNVFDALGLIF
jgi:hypothetical protein